MRLTEAGELYNRANSIQKLLMNVDEAINLYLEVIDRFPDEPESEEALSRIIELSSYIKEEPNCVKEEYRNLCNQALSFDDNVFDNIDFEAMAVEGVEN